MSDTFEIDLPEEIRGYDWKEAFEFAPFNREDVAEVIAVAEGQNDADNWVGVFKLKDGRFGYLTAWCDYTGWGCLDGGHGDTRATLADVIIELCEEDDRKRLGLRLPHST